MGDIVSAEKGRSPFIPGRPVAPDMFVGREEQIARCLRSAHQTSLGKQQNLFIIGEWGIGKSSLVSYVRSAAREKYNHIGFHILLGGVSRIDEFVQQVVSRIIQEAHQSKLERLSQFLGKYIESVELFGVSIKTSALQTDSVQIAHQFLPFLRNIWSTLKDKYKGMALYLDDLNGLATVEAFAALIKSLVDEIATSREELPLLLVLAGVSERRLEIIKNQPSVDRIFDVVEVNPLSNQEVESFFRKAFSSVNMTIKDDALKLLVEFSGGLPKLMHELGEATFWRDKDGTVDVDDASLGVVDAADVVGIKYFEPVRAAIRSSDYHSILDKLGAREFDREVDLKFNKSDLAKGLSETEKKKLDNFLQRMKNLHALSKGDIKGEWVFPNHLVRLYLYMESKRKPQ